MFLVNNKTNFFFATLLLTYSWVLDSPFANAVYIKMHGSSGSGADSNFQLSYFKDNKWSVRAGPFSKDTGYTFTENTKQHVPSVWENPSDSARYLIASGSGNIKITKIAGNNYFITNWDNSCGSSSSKSNGGKGRSCFGVTAGWYYKLIPTPNKSDSFTVTRTQLTTANSYPTFWKNSFCYTQLDIKASNFADQCKNKVVAIETDSTAENYNTYFGQKDKFHYRTAFIKGKQYCDFPNGLKTVGVNVCMLDDIADGFTSSEPNESLLVIWKGENDPSQRGARIKDIKYPGEVNFRGSSFLHLNEGDGNGSYGTVNPTCTTDAAGRDTCMRIQTPGSSNEARVIQFLSSSSDYPIQVSGVNQAFTTGYHVDARYTGTAGSSDSVDRYICETTQNRCNRRNNLRG